MLRSPIHLFSAVLALAAAAPAQDLLIRGATVHTGTAAPWTGDLLVRDGRIATPGAQLTDGAEVLELAGAHVYPGFHDAHAHIQSLGTAADTVDLVGTRSYAEVIERVAAKAAELPAGTWITGRGWDQNDWSDQAMPSHGALSQATPDHPVFLRRIDGHAALANMKAMQVAGLDMSEPDPDGGAILRDEDNQPTGVLIDRAMGFIGGAVPSPDRETVERRYLIAQEKCLAAGLTCVHDAGVSPRELEILRALHTDGRWHLRVHAMLPAAAEAAIRKGPWQTPDRVLQVRAVKAYADGALGSRGAVLLEGYTDKPGWRGLLITPAEELRRIARMCADSGFQLCTHAIGDRAVREVLDAYESCGLSQGDLRRARFRVEHAQIIDAADVARYGALGILPSMQPTHLTSDMPWAPERLGDDRVVNAYNWARFIEQGVPVPFGSDFPVEHHDPLRGIFAAVTTRGHPDDADGMGPPEGLRPDQKLSVARAIQGFTRDAAYGAFLERDLGAIEPGKLGDFTILDRDLAEVAPQQILSARVLATVIAGKVVYRPKTSSR